MRLASLAMYTEPRPVAEATALLWAFLRDELRREGLEGVPDRLDDSIAHDEAWLHPDLLLSQTCGYPYVRRLRQKVQLVATPVYAAPGCTGPSMCSFIIVARGSQARSLEGVRGGTVAVNGTDSNSGYNLLRAEIAPLARHGRFFGRVVETGGHANSIDAVGAGRADVAAIDCVTYDNIRRFDPQRLAGVRVLAETVKGPGLPFVTRGQATDEEVALLRRVLDRAIAAPGLEEVRAVLSLTGFAVLEDADYEPLAALERRAGGLGYGTIS